MWDWKERQMKRNNLRDLGVQEFPLEGLVSTGERAQVTVVQMVVEMSFILFFNCSFMTVRYHSTSPGVLSFNFESYH